MNESKNPDAVPALAKPELLVEVEAWAAKA